MGDYTAISVMVEVKPDLIDRICRDGHIDLSDIVRDRRFRKHPDIKRLVYFYESRGPFCLGATYCSINEHPYHWLNELFSEEIDDLAEADKDEYGDSYVTNFFKRQGNVVFSYNSERAWRVSSSYDLIPNILNLIAVRWFVSFQYEGSGSPDEVRSNLKTKADRKWFESMFRKNGWVGEIPTEEDILNCTTEFREFNDDVRSFGAGLLEATQTPQGG